MAVDAAFDDEGIIDILNRLDLVPKDQSLVRLLKMDTALQEGVDEKIVFVAIHAVKNGKGGANVLFIVIGVGMGSVLGVEGFEQFGRCHVVHSFGGLVLPSLGERVHVGMLGGSGDIREHQKTCS